MREQGKQTQAQALIMHLHRSVCEDSGCPEEQQLLAYASCLALDKEKSFPRKHSSSPSSDVGAEQATVSTPKDMDGAQFLKQLT